MGRSCNYTYIKHLALKGAALRGTTTPLGSADPLSPFRRLVGYLVGPLDSIEHAIDSLMRDTLSTPHDLGKQPKCPSLAMHPMDDIQSVWVMQRLL